MLYDTQMSGMESMKSGAEGDFYEDMYGGNVDSGEEEAVSPTSLVSRKGKNKKGDEKVDKGICGCSVIF